VGCILLPAKISVSTAVINPGENLELCHVGTLGSTIEGLYDPVEGL
jgi:hypothetical protein